MTRYDDKLDSAPTKQHDSSQTDERRRIIEEYANGLREILQKLCKLKLAENSERYTNYLFRFSRGVDMR